MAASARSGDPVWDASRVVAEVLRGGPLTGHEIAQAAAGRVVGNSIAWLYPALYRLEAQSGITSRWEVTGGNVRRRYLLLGAAGSRRAAWRSPYAQVGPPPGLDGPRPVPEPGAVAAYLDRVVQALTLSAAEKTAIRRELADHFEDARSHTPSAAPSPAARPTRPEDLFGLPEQLAGAITRALADRRSLAATLRTALPGALGAFVFATALTAAVLPLARVFCEIALRLALSADAWAATPALNQRQQAFPLIVGAYVAARLVGGKVLTAGAKRGPLTAAGLATAATLALGIPAVCLQMEIDLLTALVMLAIPAAVVWGALSPVGPLRELVSGRGVAAAAILGSAVIAAPLNGILVYSVPGGFERGQPGIAFWVQPIGDFDSGGAEGWFHISNRDAAKEVCVEARPLVVTGWWAGTDASYSPSPICQPVELDEYLGWTLPAPEAKGRYWVVLTSFVRPDGSVTILSGELVAPSNPNSIVGWLSDRLP